eukprot:1363418-Rhodomonas_salina.2
MPYGVTLPTYAVPVTLSACALATLRVRVKCAHARAMRYAVLKEGMLVLGARGGVGTNADQGRRAAREGRQTGTVRNPVQKSALLVQIAAVLT